MPLPDKKYYTLNEVAEEWKRDVDFLLEQFENGRLIPSIRLPELVGDLWHSTTDPVWIDEEMGWDWDGVKEVTGEQVGNGEWYLPAYCYGRIQFDTNGDRFIDIKDCFLSKDRIVPRLWFSPSYSQSSSYQNILLTDLLVSHEEKESFYRSENLPSARNELLTRERNNLLRIIGALVRLYVSYREGNQYGEAVNVNKRQVIEALHQHLDSSGLDTKGMESSTLQEKFTKALRLVGERQIIIPTRNDSS